MGKIKEVEILDIEDANEFDLDDYYTIEELETEEKDLPKSIINRLKDKLNSIENYLYTVPSFVSSVKELIPKYTYNLVFTDEQKRKLATGSIKLLTKKDGTLLATIVDPETKKIISGVNIEKIKLNNNITSNILDYTSQMQMAQIAEKIDNLQLSIDEVKQGQEDDRLALAESSKQMLLQALYIKDEENKNRQLHDIIASAEKSRQQLKLSHLKDIEYINNTPEDLFKKIIYPHSLKQVDVKLQAAKKSLNALNMVSLVEAISYQELGEIEAANKSLEWFNSFIKQEYLDKPDRTNRLDSNDSKRELYWSKTLTEISSSINKLLDTNKTKLLEENKNEK